MSIYLPTAPTSPIGNARVAPRPLLVLSSIQKLVLPLGAVAFDLLFCLERPGLNVLLYTVGVVAATVAGLPRYAPQWRSGYAWALLAGTILSAILVAVYGSGAAQLACVVSMAGWLGYLNQPHLRQLGYAVLTAGANAFRILTALPTVLRFPTHFLLRLERGWFYGRLLVLPLGALLIFHGLFVVANPAYAGLVSRAMVVLGQLVEELLRYFSPVHAVFLGLGLATTAALVLRLPVHRFADAETQLEDLVVRRRNHVASLAVRQPDFRARSVSSLGLRKEYLMAIGLLGLVNLLLLVVNAVDIRWIWFGFKPAPGFDLTQFVHEGTYVLIFSILLAMGILLWFFRRNLNFYQPGRPVLQLLATTWVVQNAVLAVSVGLRNYYYILYTGLAYKRIGVCFFLGLVVFGLGTLLLKIWQHRSASYLVRLNSLAAYGVLLLLAAGNWEIWIARYNLNGHRVVVDYGFLLAMPDRVLPTLAANAPTLDNHRLQQQGPDGTYYYLTSTEARHLLRQRVRAFQAQQARRHWPSYTWADWQAARELAALPQAPAVATHSATR